MYERYLARALQCYPGRRRQCYLADGLSLRRQAAS